METKLMEFICPKCKKSLTWANQTAIVYCKRCDKWVRAKDIKEVNPARMDAEGDNNQLTLF